MRKNIYIKSLLYLIAFCLLGSGTVYAVSAGKILTSFEAEQADILSFQAETEVFKAIGMGIALTLAQCNLQDPCSPDINNDEIDQLLDTLNARIDDLVNRQQEGQDEFSDIITAYVDERENILRFKSELDKITIIEEVTPATPVSPGVDLSVFADEDEEIFDFEEEDIEDEPLLEEELDPEQAPEVE